MDDHEQTEIAHDRRITRRRMLLGTAGVAGAAAILAACGDDDDSSSATSAAATTAGGAAPTTAGGSATTTGGGSATTAGAGSTDLTTLLGIDAASAGKGKTIELGAVLALTGTGSFYGKTMSRGLDLAAKHILELGGPTFKYTYLDHKSGDPAAGVQAMAELVSKGIQAKFASYGDDITAMLSSTIENKVFTFDGGGGTGITAQNKPYFWGTGRSPRTTRCRACSSGPRRLIPTPRRLASSSGISARTTTRAPRTTSWPSWRPAGTSSTASTSWCRSAARTSPGAPQVKANSPTSCCS